MNIIFHSALAFDYMMLNGVVNETNYPYLNLKQPSCRKPGLRNVVPKQHIVKSMEIDFKGDEESLRKFLHRVDD